VGDELSPVEARPEAPNDGLNVCERSCGRCLFGARPHVPWDYGERKALAALASGRHFTCHEWGNVMCRGFYDTYGEQLPYIVWARENGLIKWRKR